MAANDVKKEQTKRKYDRRFYIFLILSIIFLVCVIYYSSVAEEEEEYNPTSSLVIFDPDSTDYPVESEENIDSTTTVVTDGVLHVHMIDCGQADSFLFEQNGEYGLIDCGTRSTGKDVVNYLKNEGVDKLQFVMGTHPHDDHMGGMYDVLDNFRCDVVYMPKIETGLVTTNWYIKLMTQIKENKIKTINPKLDDTFYLGDAVFVVVGQLTPEEAGSNVNNYSTVVKVSFGEMDILMTGDAETRVEEKMLETRSNELQCEILKLGHHGSNTSTSDEFLKCVAPDYGLISCEVGNKYSHPSTETVKKLKANKVKIYRTDEASDVVLSISSDSVSFNKKPGDYLDGDTIMLKTKKESK